MTTMYNNLNKKIHEKIFNNNMFNDALKYFKNTQVNIKKKQVNIPQYITVRDLAINYNKNSQFQISEKDLGFIGNRLSKKVQNSGKIQEGVFEVKQYKNTKEVQEAFKNIVTELKGKEALQKAVKRKASQKIVRSRKRKTASYRYNSNNINTKGQRCYEKNMTVCCPHMPVNTKGQYAATENITIIKYNGKKYKLYTCCKMCGSQMKSLSNYEFKQIYKPIIKSNYMLVHHRDTGELIQKLPLYSNKEHIIKKNTRKYKKR